MSFYQLVKFISNLNRFEHFLLTYIFQQEVTFRIYFGKARIVILKAFQGYKRNCKMSKMKTFKRGIFSEIVIFLPVQFNKQMIPQQEKVQQIIFLQIYRLEMNLCQKIFLISLLIAIISAKSQYKVVSNLTTSSNITLTLQYTGTDDYYIYSTNPLIKSLVFILQVHTFNDFYFKITDINQTRYEIPLTDPFPNDPLANSTFPLNMSGIKLEYTVNPFDFRILRKSNNATLFSTYDHSIIFSQYYIEIGTQVDSNFIYGLGQRFQLNFRKTPGKWTIFNRDRPQQIDYGAGRQTYGFYPVYLLKQKQNLFHFSYFKNSNGMDVFINQTRADPTVVTYKTIGGIIHFRFILGDSSPEALLKKWNTFLGTSTVPPFWSLGFHQCRWGYHRVQDLETVIQKYAQNDLPLDTIWSDIDYMLHFEDFTIDESRFPLDRMKKILESYYYVPIIDAGIKIGDGFAYNEGLKRNVYVKTPTGKDFVGAVWPGATTFVDFLHPNSTQYWIDMLDSLYKKIPFSGIWLDMNQFSSFCNGPCPFTPYEYPKIFDYTHDIPYHPGNQGNVEKGTISLNSTHYGNVTDANVRNFNGLFEMYNSNLFLKGKNKRPFIISRSSTLGSNKYGFHWTGDNYADFQFLRASIVGNFNFQLFGIQMVGADMCGFGGNTNEELCARWFQLGSLYTFARDHNGIEDSSQQPYALGPVVLETARNNLKLRYSLLKHYYSIFVQQSGTGSIFRPVFFEFPDDAMLYNDQICNEQFLIGTSLLAAPIVYAKMRDRQVYFPKLRWYDLYSGKVYDKGNHTLTNISLTAKVPLFLAEGKAIFLQNTANVTKTNQLTNVFEIVAGLHLESNGSTTISTGNGSMISIQNYNDEPKLTSCLSQGCQYAFKLNFTQTQTSSQLEISCVYSGASGLNQQFLINRVKLYLNGNVYVKDLTENVVFKGTDKKMIDMGQKFEDISDFTDKNMRIAEQ